MAKTIPRFGQRMIRRTHGFRDSSKKPLLVLLAFVSVSFTLLIGEGIARYFFKKNLTTLSVSDDKRFYKIDPFGYRIHIPNKVGEQIAWNKDGKIEVRINQWGFRGPPIKKEKPNNTYRILFLGDSITFGGRLNEADIFVSKIQQKLRTKIGHPIQIINAGQGDTGTAQHLKILSKGLKLDPDLVVYCWYLNDNRPPQGFPGEKINDHFLLRWFDRQTWIHRSYLAGFIYHKLRQGLINQVLVTSRQNERFEWVDLYNSKRWLTDLNEFKKMIHLARYDWGDAWGKRSFEKTAKNLARIKSHLDRHKTKFALISMPLSCQVYAAVPSPLTDRPQLALGRLTAETSVPFLNLLPSLRAHKDKIIYYDQCHYTPLGNTLVADRIAKFLAEKFPELELS